MKPAAIDTTSATDRRMPHPLISRRMILILSGLLIGMSLRHGMERPDPDLPGTLVAAQIHFITLVAGLTGFASFACLDAVARRQRRNQIRKTLERMNWILETRLHKHIPRRHTPAPQTVRMVESDTSFLSVVRSGQR